jgi:hypothetical protein
MSSELMETMWNVVVALMEAQLPRLRFQPKEATHRYKVNKLSRDIRRQNLKIERRRCVQITVV